MEAVVNDAAPKTLSEVLVKLHKDLAEEYGDDGAQQVVIELIRSRDFLPAILGG